MKELTKANSKLRKELSKYTGLDKQIKFSFWKYNGPKLQNLSSIEIDGTLA